MGGAQSRWARQAGLGLVAVVLVVATGCRGAIEVDVDNARAGAGVPAVARDSILDEAADAKAAEMCAAGVATPSPDPLERYDAESARAIDELVGAAELDPATADPAARNSDATNEVWAGWAGDPTITDGRWDQLGIGEVECADGDLYMALVFKDLPSMPASGRYSTTQHTAAQLVTTNGLQYGTAVTYQGTTIPLLLDLYQPPAGPVAARPTIVLIHGGSFSGGSRTDLASAAREYARRGFVVASIDYRLQPNSTPTEQLQAATNAIDDATESVRWLKANAATYGIDTTRIGLVGSSAGGAIALGVGNWSDPTPGGPLAAFDPAVAAAVSTGAHLTPGLALIDFDEDDAPALMFHYETDTVTGNTDEYAFETCAAIRGAGNTCDFRVQAGSGHTVSISAGGGNWVPTIGPFLWTHLRLAA
jgi:dienelactone hydrolase